jgi:GntR family transcriptional regulator/MocR family aminotransferase
MLDLKLSGTGTLQAQVYEALRGAIIGGFIREHERLPSSRTLASSLGLSRTTTQLAYEQLISQGYARSAPRSGVYVEAGVMAPRRAVHVAERSGRTSGYAKRLSRTGQPLRPDRVTGSGLIDFNYMLDVASPESDSSWRRAVRKSVYRRHQGYPDPAGLPRLREEVCQYLGRRHRMAISPEQVMIVSGVQQALNLCARLLVDPGDPVMMEEPGYPQARFVFQQEQATLWPIMVDGLGARIDPDEIARLKPRLIYTTPAHQFPLGGVLPPSGRNELLAAARAAGGWIFEDDYDGEFLHTGTPIESLCALDGHGCVIHVGSFSKTLDASLRLAYLVLPVGLVDLFTRARLIQDQGPPALTQGALAEFIASGSYERHIFRTRKLLASRGATLVGTLHRCLGDRVEVEGSGTGSFLVAWLPGFKRSQVPELCSAMISGGVHAHEVGRYYCNPPDRIGLLFGYGSVEEANVAVGINRFADVVSRFPSSL